MVFRFVMKKEAKVILGLLLFFILFYLFFNYIPSRNLEKNHRYTIAEIVRFETQSEGAKEAKIVYSFKGVNYHGSFPLLWGYENKFVVGQRVFIKFHSENPNNAKVEYDIQVPDSLFDKNDGWKKIPI